MLKKLNISKKASTVSRVLKHFNSDKPCAIVSAYLYQDPETNELVSEKENKEKQTELKKELRAQGFGPVELIAQFNEDGNISSEESLLVPNMPFEKAVAFGQKYNQHSILAKDDGQMVWVSTRDNPGEILQRFTKEQISEADFVGAFSKLKYGNPNARNKRIKLSYLAEMIHLNISPVASLKSRLHPDFVFIEDGRVRAFGNFFEKE